MNISNAHMILVHTARLVELAATFEARYGSHYTLKPGSPDDAWTLYHKIFDLQCIIARSLNTLPSDSLQHKHGEWWKRQDVLDTKTAEAIACTAAHLIACTASYMEYDQHSTEDWSYAMRNTCNVIAGLLHPNALQIAADEGIELELHIG